MGRGEHQSQRDKQNSVRIWRDSADACHEQGRQNEYAYDTSEDVGSTRAESHVDSVPSNDSRKREPPAAVAQPRRASRTTPPCLLRPSGGSRRRILGSATSQSKLSIHFSVSLPSTDGKAHAQPVTAAQLAANLPGVGGAGRLRSWAGLFQPVSLLSGNSDLPPHVLQESADGAQCSSRT